MFKSHILHPNQQKNLLKESLNVNFGLIRGMPKQSTGICKRSSSMSKRSLGTHKRSPGTPKRSPGTPKQSPEKLETLIAPLFSSFEHREKKSMLQPHIPHPSL